MRFLIDLLYLLALPVLLPALLVVSRGFTRRRYRAGLGEKLGLVAPRAGAAPCVWVHAVSVGEARTALPLVRELLERLPDWDVVVSTATDTGHDVIAGALGGLPPRVRQVYFPCDLSLCVESSLRALRPRLVVLLELELWPNFLLAARRRGIPVLVANGRLTERSARRYAKCGALGRRLFALPTAVAAQNEAYAARFRRLGVAEERLTVLGNLKHDVPAPADSAAAAREICRRIGWPEPGARGRGRPVLAGGCTHPGEETALLATARALLARHPDLGLVLAPRHIERAESVVEEAERAGLGPVRRASDTTAPDGGAAAGETPRVVVVDRIGELDRYYALADVVFIGGSLIPRGGHNLLEPARHGRALLFGPSTYNFDDIAAHLLSRDAGLRVADAADLTRAAGELLDRPEERDALGGRARAAAAELEGALGRHIEWILARSGPAQE